jgi:hypothetical protein
MAEFDDQRSRVPESVFLVGIQHNGMTVLV